MNLIKRVSKFARLRQIDWADIAPVVFIILLLGGYWFYSRLLPTPPYQAYDPEYQYFMNSLAAFKGAVYDYIDHPGTPVEIIGTAILGLTYPFLANTQRGFIYYHLQHPNVFLNMSYAFLTLISIGCAWFFYLTARASRHWLPIFSATALAIMFYVIHPLAFPTLALWSHSSFNFPFGTLLLLILFRMVQREGEISPWALVGMGLGIGILTAIMVYFAAWVIGAIAVIVVFYRLQKLSWRKTLPAAATLGLSSIAGFFGAILPILEKWPMFFGWIKQLTFHQGIYGRGADGIITLSTAKTNLVELIRQSALLFAFTAIILFLLVFALIRLRHQLSGQPGLWALAAGLALQIFIVLVLIVKHPNSRYLLAITAILPVLMLVALRLFEDNKTLNRLISGLFIALVFFSLPFALFESITSQRAYTEDLLVMEQQSTQAIQKYAQKTGREPGDLTILWSYGTYSTCTSLIYGNHYAGEAFTKELWRLCPQQFTLTSFNPGSAVSQVAEIKWDLIVIRKYFWENLPLGPIGTAEEFLPGLDDGFGSLVIVQKVQ